MNRCSRGGVEILLGYTLALVSCWLVSAVMARAQMPITLGPSIGYSFGVPLTVERASGVVNRYGGVRPGSSYDHAFWFGVAALADGVPGEGWDLAGELGLALSSGRFTSDPFQFGLSYDAVADTFVSPNRSFELTSNASAMQLDLAVGRRLGECWSLRLGGWLQYSLASDFIQTESLLDQPGVTFSDSTRSHLVAAGDGLGSGPLRYGLLFSGTFGASVVGGGMILVQRADLRLDLPALLDGLGLRALRVGGGVSLLFDHGSAPSVTPPPLPPVSSRLSPRAAIELFAIGDDSSRSRVALVATHETIHRVVVAFPGTIVLDDEIEGMPRYAHLTREDAAGFSLRSLARLAPRELDRQLLSVLGHRLRSEPRATVTLLYPAETEEHAAWLRDYLHGVWGIEPARVGLRREPSPPTTSSPSRVTIVSSSDELTAPILSEWMVRELRAPALGMTERVEAEAGLRAWRLTIARGERELARYDGTRLAELRSVDLSLHLDGRSIEGTAPLVATLMVIDSASDTAVARDTMELRRDSAVVARSMLGRYVLTRHGDAGAVVAAALADIPAGAVVTVTSVGSASGIADAPDADPGRVAELILAGLRARGIAVGDLFVRHARGDEGALPPDATVDIVVDINAEF